jgi:Protein of unknown function (DUF3071)
MRELRFVGPGEDGNHVIVETADGEEAFSLPVDNDLRGAVRGELTPVREVRTSERPVTPRDIQVRVRAGESPQAIADESGMPLDRVLVFGRQVLEERTRITDEARRARARRNTADGQLVEFGAAVDSRFTAHDIEPSDVVWDASRSADSHWVVSATWRGGDADRIARWSFALGTRTLAPLDETAADLLSDRPIRPIVRAVPDLPPAASPEATTGPLPWPPANGLSLGAGASETRPAAGEDEAAPPLPLHVTDAPASAGPGRRSSRSSRGARNPAVPGVSAPAEIPAGPRVAASLPAEPAHADEPPGPEPGKSAKPKVPSWDDILLGVRRKRD